MKILLKLLRILAVLILVFAGYPLRKFSNLPIVFLGLLIYYDIHLKRILIITHYTDNENENKN